MKNMYRKINMSFFAALLACVPAFAQDAWLERVGQGVSLVAATYAVNYVHESGHWLFAESRNYDADIEVHPFSGHAEVTSKSGSRINREDRGLIGLSGPLTTRGTYELLNMYMANRQWDWLTPFLSWTAVGLRLDLPWQQLKAGWAHSRGSSDRRENDINLFYDSLSGGKVEREAFHFIGAAISLWDLWTDADEIMGHISGGLGEQPVSDRRQRNWFLSSDGASFALDWRYGF